MILRIFKITKIIISALAPSYFTSKAKGAIVSRFKLPPRVILFMNPFKTLFFLSFSFFIAGVFLPMQNNLASRTVVAIEQKESLFHFLHQNISFFMLLLSLVCSWQCVLFLRKQKFHHIHENIENLCDFLINCPYGTKTEKINYCLLRRVKVQNSISVLQEIMIKERIKRGKPTRLFYDIKSLIEYFTYEEGEDRVMVVPSFINEDSIIKNTDNLLSKKLDIRHLCDNIIARSKQISL
jgi:hypothetical protein